MALLAVVTLELGDYAVIGAMLAAFAGLTTSLMLSNIKAISRRIERVEERVDTLQDKKVNQVDWLRESRSTRAKVDAVGEQIAGISNKLDTEFGIATAITRLAKSLEKRNGG